MQSLADDPQLWKAAYYSRFVRPRASRIPGLRGHDTSAKALHYSSKLSKWLEDDHLVRSGKRTNWKRQYKLRHNWSIGSCNVSHTKVAEQASIPPLLVRLYENTVFTADSTEGLRVLSMNREPTILATLPFLVGNQSQARSPKPTSLAVDASTSDASVIGVAVGFADGEFGIYIFDKRQPALALLYQHAPSSNGTVSAIAYASPYILTMTEAQLLSLYMFPHTTPYTFLPDKHTVVAPQLLSSLKSHTAWPPLSLSIRASSANVSASIAYAMPTYLAGWSVGMQEMLLTPEGRIIESRLASAEPQGFHSISTDSDESRSPSRNSRAPTSSVRNRPSVETNAYRSRPTSLSYTHPYLLAAHADNTLTVYMVTSNAGDLTIGPGRRLWGHTSSVASAHVGDRGKAVSVSKHGNELRVWELEGGTISQASRRRSVLGADAEGSIQVRPETRVDSTRKVPQKITEVQSRSKDEDMVVTKGWVAFDEEKVVVLREEQKGEQALVVYDFT